MPLHPNALIITTVAAIWIAFSVLVYQIREAAYGMRLAGFMRGFMNDLRHECKKLDPEILVRQSGMDVFVLQKHLGHSFPIRIKWRGVVFGSRRLVPFRQFAFDNLVIHREIKALMDEADRKRAGKN